MQRKSLNDLIKKTANPFQCLFLPGTTQDPIQTKKQMLLFEVSINWSLDHCATSCLESDQTLPILLSKCRSSLWIQPKNICRRCSTKCATSHPLWISASAILVLETRMGLLPILIWIGAVTLWPHDLPLATPCFWQMGSFPGFHNDRREYAFLP